MKVPKELADLEQWVIWHLQTRKGKTTKVPHRARDNRRASSTKASDWCSLDEALEGVEEHEADGVGFVFTPDDPYVGIDLDGCVLESGELHPDAEELVSELDSYTELSPSGTGVHVIVKGELDSRLRNRKKETPWGGNIEAYDHGRYFTMTGKPMNGTRVRERALKISLLEAGGVATTTEVDEGWLDSLRAGSKRFRALYDDGDVSEYDSHSEADLALCSMLAQAIGPDVYAIDQAFRSSGLMREKWQERDYAMRTISRALGESEVDESDTSKDREIRKELRRIEVRQEAMFQFRTKQAEKKEIPFPSSEWSLKDELLLPEPENMWRVQDLQPIYGNVVLIAGYKLGKTTMCLNLVRSLVDGGPFLGSFEVEQLDYGNVAIFNYELNQFQWIRWMRDMGVKNTERIKPFHLRGLGALQFWLPEIQDRVVKWMLENEIRYWVLDPTAAAWDSLLESEGDNIRAQQFTKAIDSVKDRAGIDEAQLTHHTSRDPAQQDKGRGPSALEGWYDAGWFLTGKRDALQFHAAGRDVDVTEINIAYHEDKKRSMLIDHRSEKEEVKDRKETKAVTIEILNEFGPLSQSKIGRELKARNVGVSNTKLKELLEHWAKSADNRIAFREESVGGRRQRTFYVED